MTSETRYMRNDYVLGLTQTTSHIEKTRGALGPTSVRVGANVYYDDVQKTSSPADTDVVRTTNGEGMQSRTWSAPAGYCGTLKINVYIKMGTDPDYVLQCTFTATINGNIDAATWTFYYWTARYYDVKSGATDGIFRFGDSVEDSRIENFTWTPAVMAAPFGDGLVWIITLLPMWKKTVEKPLILNKNYI